MSCKIGISYIIKFGDTLFDIAKRELGDIKQWHQILKPNGTSFAEYETNNLEVGQEICLPQRTKEEKIYTVCLNAEDFKGRDAYTVIQSVFGKGAIEAPDNCDSTHAPHITQDTDNSIGNHFVFHIHRDQDCDPVTHSPNRQRCEIKVFNRSDDKLKGYKGATFAYDWRFQINNDMTVSKSFTHFFQLKSVGSNTDTPLVTISGAKVKGIDKIQVRFITPLKEKVLADYNWSDIKGEWLNVYCQAKFDYQGYLILTIKKLDGTLLLSVKEPNLNLWQDGDYVRPKWGIYRSLNDKKNLRPNEETVRFANFSITNGNTLFNSYITGK
ncbi:LysM domain-containing protein [Desmonostoc muscorum LEGE 12446]|uniref:LysM peptidoglycan-binding domain-containing protein n=1 Tax=Desmonostoc muscorum LEGE 12446 TaxID=1828758 RepID=A0A8J7D0R0_DESMC|nr:LysM domain-containing protein [Desmonostoc muscorum]MCF2152068.1 LysM domain-containing protein [Desmonostoc muscorum LEGE 12446]